MLSSMWLRCKRRLAKFQPEFLPMAEYVAFKSRPVRRSYVCTEPVGWWSNQFEPRLVTEKLAYNRRRIRKLLQEDTALQKLLGYKEHVVEVLIRENQALVAVFASQETFRRHVGHVFAYNSKAEQHGNFRFVWTNHPNYGSFDFHVVHPQNNPIVDPHDPLFIYRPFVVE